MPGQGGLMIAFNTTKLPLSRWVRDVYMCLRETAALSSSKLVTSPFLDFSGIARTLPPSLEQHSRLRCVPFASFLCQTETESFNYIIYQLQVEGAGSFNRLNS